MRLIIVLSFLLVYTSSLAQTFFQQGIASFYANKFDGRLTASGVVFSNNEMTAAHRTLAFGTVVKVTNLSNNKTVVVTITDRGPFIKGRIIDLSQLAAKKLGFYQQGLSEVTIELYPIKQSNDSLLLPLHPLPNIRFETPLTRPINISLHKCFAYQL